MDARATYWRNVIAVGHARSHTLVADAGGIVVGFASVGPARDEQLDPSRVGELYAIYVEPDASGAGIGRALMAELLERLRREAFEEAILWVLEDNPRTRTFYELAGWRADGAAKDDTILGTRVREVRYRRALRD